MKKPAVTSRPIHQLLAQRWSPRAFDPAGGVSAEQIGALCEAARWSPSCFGEEPWAFVVCPRAEAAAWEGALSCLVEGNRWWAQNAAVLIAVCANQNFARNGRPNRHFAYDAGAAALAMVLQAEALGLRAHQMGGFDPARARAVFRLPDGCESLAMMAIGVQAAADSIEDGDKRAAELAPRKRKPLGENFFAGVWGAPLAE